MPHICQLTSAHPRYDTRIFLKQCSSLVRHGYAVTLIVADGLGDERKNGVEIVDVGKPAGRLDRMVNATQRVLKRALAIDADIYHLHDPELIPAGLRLKAKGKQVIFDAHEDLPQQILSKPYLPRYARRTVSAGAELLERQSLRWLDGVVAATPFIQDKFLRMGLRCVDINNYPILGELDAEIDGSITKTEISYLGGVTEVRGVRELVQALALVKSATRLNIAGEFSGPELKTQMERLPGWTRVNALGFLGRTQVRDVLSRSAAGVVTFLPEPNHINSQPNKLFEYMSAGIPVISSHFPLWREIVEGSECGVCVDPQDPAAIAAAIDWLVTNPREAHVMGANGREAVRQRYNWGAEETKLMAFCDSLAKIEAAA